MTEYRYTLTRNFITGEGTCVWIMLNPSTADAIHDDPTIRRCIDFTRRWGFHRMIVVNLYAARATDPKQLFEMGWPTGGMKNDDIICDVVRTARRVVCAWGAHGDHNGRGNQVVRMIARIFPLDEKTPDLVCLGTNKGGSPKHPLYVKADTDPLPYTITDAYWQDCCETTMDRLEESQGDQLVEEEEAIMRIIPGGEGVQLEEVAGEPDPDPHKGFPKIPGRSEITSCEASSPENRGGRE